jgi:hypothetical protein
MDEFREHIMRMLQEKGYTNTNGTNGWIPDFTLQERVTPMDEDELAFFSPYEEEVWDV